jgi:hypothetical protein
MVVVGGAAVGPFVAEKTTMLIIGLVFSIFGIGYFWLLFTLAVYALPFFAGVNVFLAAFQSGVGVIGAIVVGVRPAVRRWRSARLCSHAPGFTDARRSSSWESGWRVPADCATHAGGSGPPSAGTPSAT